MMQGSTKLKSQIYIASIQNYLQNPLLFLIFTFLSLRELKDKEEEKEKLEINKHKKIRWRSGH